MQISSLHTFSFPLRGLLLAVFAGLSLAACQTDEPGPSAGGDAATLQAVLEELRAIRQVVDKIEQQQDTGRTAQRPSRPTTATVAVDGKPALGSATAPVTVVEFTDYQCPYCLRFTTTTFPDLRRGYIDTGKVRWVALNLPLDFHKDARKAAQAALCAGEQDRFWEMRTELFRHPQELAGEYLPARAAAVGLDDAAFRECLASDRHLAAIDKDAEDARAVRVTGTPSFIVGRTAGDKITGQVVIGAQPKRVFEAAIEQLLEPDPDEAAGKAAGQPGTG